MTGALAALLAAVGPCLPLPPSPNDEITRCASFGKGGEVRVLPETVRRLDFSEGPAVIAIGARLFYVDRGGRAVEALPFDNGADPFVEGLARTIRGGKVGFVDPRLRIVVAPRWDFAFPFRNGVAVVCEDCREVAEGEHHRREGGRWGYVDRGGRVVVPVTFPKDRLPPEEEVRRLRLPRPAESAGPAEKPCREHPRLVGACFPVRGRMRLYNGTPTVRIWPVGTRRLLLVSESRFRLGGYANLPEEVSRRLSWSSDLFADFEACPFTLPEPGVAQLVCVDAAKNASTRKRDGSPVGTVESSRAR